METEVGTEADVRAVDAQILRHNGVSDVGGWAAVAHQVSVKTETAKGLLLTCDGSVGTTDMTGVVSNTPRMIAMMVRRLQQVFWKGGQKVSR